MKQITVLVVDVVESVRLMELRDGNHSKMAIGADDPQKPHGAGTRASSRVWVTGCFSNAKSRSKHSILEFGCRPCARTSEAQLPD
jgi:hypothetical protein